MRAVFFGTPEWAVPSLEALKSMGVEVGFVVTNPDKPAGRGMAHTQSPIKRQAIADGLEVLQPARASDPELATRLERDAPDVAVVVAYGKILPGGLLDIPPRGFVNVHFSLLPEYRGAAPVQRALMDGCTRTGVSLIRLTAGMDEGPIIATESTEIAPDDTAGTLGARLAVVGAELLTRTLADYVEGEIVPEEQDHDKATYASKITSEDARIEWGRSGTEIRDFVRGLNPDPGAWTTYGNARWRVLRVEPTDGVDLGPGELLSTKKALIVGTGDGGVDLVEVQPAGKKAMAGADLARGLRLADKEKLQ
jgi:methionyl-tRNA formyltransferase